MNILNLKFIDLVIDKMPYVVFILNTNYEIIKMNNLGLELIRAWRNEQIINNLFNQLGINNSLRKTIENSMLKKGIWKGEITNGNEGSESIVYFSFIPFLYNGISYTFVIGEEITNQKKTIDLLVHSYKYMEMILNRLNPLFVCNEYGHIVYANRAFLMISGFDIIDIEGRNVRGIIEENVSCPINQTVKEILSGEKDTAKLTAMIRTRNGTVKCDLYISKFSNDGGCIFSLNNIFSNEINSKDIFYNSEVGELYHGIIEREFENAGSIIKQLIPGLVEDVGFLTVRYRYYPLETIGGDVFFFKKISKDKFSVFVGDVAGHGLSASLFLALVKSTAMRLTVKYGLRPSRYLKALNSELITGLANYFLTALYGCFYSKGDSVRFVCSRAGHPPPIIIRRKSWEIESINLHGKPIGLIEDVNFSEAEVDMITGDRLILYTDGILEVKGENGTDLGMKGFKNIIKKRMRSDIDTFIHEVIGDLHDFCVEGNFNDDIVLVVMDIN